MRESRKVGLGTTVEYTERKFKTKAWERHVAKKPWRSPGSNLRHQIAYSRSMFPSNVLINILRGLPCRLESLRLKFTNEPSIFVCIDGDLNESIKRSASDRLGDLVPQVRARTSPGVFRDMALLGLCLKLSLIA